MAKQKKGCFLRTLIGIAAVVVVIGIIAAMGSDGDSEGPEKITANPGETVTTEKLDLSVQKLELTETVGGDFLESSASEGGMYVALKYKYKNITEEPIGMFGQPSASLIAPGGTEYTRDTGASASYAGEEEIDEKLVSDLNPGIAVTTVDVFEVSKEKISENGWKIVFDTDPRVEVPLHKKE